MYWWIPAAGAALGAYLGHEQQKSQDAARTAQAEANMYAPLFGQAPTAMGARQDVTTPGALSGFMAGYGIASQLGMGGGQQAAAQPQTNTANPNTTAWVPYGQTQNQSMGAPQRNPLDYYYASSGYSNPYSLGG